jgi:hypothetical protein
VASRVKALPETRPRPANDGGAANRGGGIWAIPSFFNPAGDRSRLGNDRIFRQHVAVPLLAVELAIDSGGCWRLSTGKPEMHRYVRDCFAARREDDWRPNAEPALQRAAA